MRDRTDATEIHDYVDDRMDPAARAAFERRLAGEPELARRVEALREVGRALRVDEPLPPGFHDRLRERIAQAGTPARSRALPWWGAPLAAAAALVLLVAVPYLMRRPEPAPTTIARAARPSEARVPEKRSGDLGASRTDTAVPEERSRLDEGKADESAAPAGPAPKKAAIPPEPPGSKYASSEPAAEGPVAAADAFVPAPAAPPAAAPAPPAAGALQIAEADRDETPRPQEAEALGRVSAPERQVVSAPPAAARRAAPAKSAETVRVDTWPGFPLPAGVVPAEPFEIVEGGEAWRARLRQVGATAPPGLDAVGESERVVLVGAGAGALDCGGSIVVETATTWSLRPAPAATAASGSSGCAWLLPRDGRRVVVEPP